MSAASYHMLSVSSAEESIALVTLGRPDVANALNTAMAEEIAGAFSALAKDSAIRAVILTGAGNHFCAGADLKERRGMNERAWHAQHAALEKAHAAILNCPLPVIAAVNGAAIGGGLELALAADFIYASEDARFALTEATLGIMPGLGGTQLLPRAVGDRRAKELLFTGAPFSAQEAFEWGLVNQICAPETLMVETTTQAVRIAANAPLAIRAIKRSVREGSSLPLPKALSSELALYNSLLSTKDRQEGINAFNDKRKPVFTGK